MRNPLLNDTKWNELRIAMYEMATSPAWRTCDLETGHISDWDREWYYHFQNCGYATIDWVEIRCESSEHGDAILNALREVHLPGKVTEEGFKIFGYSPPSGTVSYI